MALPPGTVSGEPYRNIAVEQILISPAKALQLLESHLGKSPQATSLTLEHRGETLSYSVFGDGRSFKIDAVTGDITIPMEPDAKTRMIRHAHFFNFAGSGRTYLLATCALLSALSTLSGIALLVTRFQNRR